MGKKRISSLTQFLSECSGQKVWVGVDVHKRSYSVAVCREDGQTASWRTCPDNDTLMYQLASHQMNIQVLVYESGPTGFGLARSCQQAGIPVMVAAPSRIIRPVLCVKDANKKRNTIKVSPILLPAGRWFHYRSCRKEEPGRPIGNGPVRMVLTRAETRPCVIAIGPNR